MSESLPMIATEISEEHSKGGVRKELQGSHATGRNVTVMKSYPV